MTRSLLVAPQWIGDAVMTEPLVRILSARGERISVGALPWVAPVYRAMPGVAEVLEFAFAHGGLQWRARRAWARRLAGRFDRAYVAPNSIKSALLPWWAGIRQRWGYHGEGRWGLLTHRLPNPPKDQRPPMVAFYAALAGQTAVDVSDPRLQLDAATVACAVADRALSLGSYAVVVPGAEYGPAKRWPVSHFARLLQAWGRTAVVLGSAKDAALGEALVVQGGADVRNLAGKTTLTQAMSLVAAARFVVTNDSGLMHVAAALDVPQVAVFGSSSPLHTPPLSRRAEVLWLKTDTDYRPPLECAPCFQRTCPLGHTRCLQDVEPQRVIRALEKLGVWHP